ncbi:hypothetical protein ACQY0O_001667 [Thecaphora frezii]
MAPVGSNDRLTVGSRVIIAQDADLRGEISIGSGTVIHPRATVYALHGPISIGSDCIIEETATIVNRHTELMQVGNDNLFEVGCRIEAASIGSSNVFSVRCRVASTVRVGSFCTIGAGCNVVPAPLWPRNVDDLFSDDEQTTDLAAAAEAANTEGTDTPRTEGTDEFDTSRPKPADPVDVCEALPDRTVVFGKGASRRLWSGEGSKAQAAQHAKHLEYLREMIPNAHKLKIVQAVRTSSPPSASSSGSLDAGSRG